MSMHAHEDIRIGTLVPVHERTPEIVRQLLPLGFETFQLSFGHRVGELDLKRLAGELGETLSAFEAADGVPRTISALGLYGNPLTSPEVVADWERLIDAAPFFSCRIIAGFAGRIPHRPVPESLPAFTTVFTRLADRAATAGLRIAFENCEKRGSWRDGDWNIAFTPRAWELMFEAVPNPVLGLEWEPCHQLMCFADPLPQLRQWVDRIWHIHGKDAMLLDDVIRTHGIRAGVPFAHHCLPGCGDTDWTRLIGMLRMAGWRGSIDIEGYHDPVFTGPLETTGQAAAFEHLCRCRGGPFVANVF
ncbi:MAG: sugar phosphate isomerase/epimerase [Pirellulales bacterium]|jgi:sugar phosphate isomerase/epimerase|nr:sugar phosphate isomerase/epimerase [Pirellulales bacterium]